MGELVFSRIKNSDNINNIPKEDGNVILCGDGKIFFDYDTERINAGGLNQSNLDASIKLINEETDKKIDEIKPIDSGWLDLTLSQGVSQGSYGGIPQYRQINNQVFIRGGFAFNKTTSPTNLATLPEEFRPKDNNVYFFMPVGGSNVARGFIAPSGTIYVEWIYSLTTDSQVTGDVAWANINLSFFND